MAKYLPGCSNYIPSIQKAVEVCKSKIRCSKSVKEQLTLSAPISKNGQTRSNNSSAICGIGA